MNELLDPSALDALRRDRQAPAPDEARARVGSRLGVYGPIPPQPPHGTTASAKAPRMVSASASAAGAGARWLGRVAVFVAGGAVGAALHAALVRAPSSQLVSIARGPRLAAQLAGEAPLPSAASSGRPAVPAAVVANASATPSVPASAAGTAHAGMARLDAERAMLDAARSSLISGDHEAALRMLERHERAYPRPLLGDERDALFVQALVRAGRYDEARARADALRRRSPNSLFLSAVDAAISTIP